MQANNMLNKVLFDFIKLHFWDNKKGLTINTWQKTNQVCTPIIIYSETLQIKKKLIDCNVIYWWKKIGQYAISSYLSFSSVNKISEYMYINW